MNKHAKQTMPLDNHWENLWTEQILNGKDNFIKEYFYIKEDA